MAKKTTPKKKAPKTKKPKEPNIERIMERYPEETFLKADGYDEALLGVDEPTMRLIYSISKCLKVLARDMSYEEAREFFDFNVSGAFVGEKTPIWCDDEN